MRVMVALEDRFFRTQNGNIYSNTVYDYVVWSKYLQVFDEVVVLARVADISEEKLEKSPTNGPNVSFLALPTFIGPWQYLKNFRKINATVKKAIKEADAFLLRVPSTICDVLWHHLKRGNIPYAVEVVGDPWDSLAPGTVKSIVREIARRNLCRNMAKQCQGAFAATYVTESTLQKRYPTTGWQTYFSDVNLSNDAVIDDAQVENRINETKAKLISNAPLRICYVGSLAQLYKAPDVLIDAVSLCIARGLNLELVILGDGKYKKQLEQRVEKLGLGNKVRFLGNVSPAKAVFDQLDQSVLYVLPSRVEGLPRALVEAMARGLPCISSPVGGIPELLKPEDLVPPGDPEALALKIESVLSDANLLAKMARRNLEKAKQYRADDLNKRRIEFHKKILEKTRWMSPRSA